MGKNYQRQRRESVMDFKHICIKWGNNMASNNTRYMTPLYWVAGHCHHNAKKNHKQFKCYKPTDQATDQQTRSPVSAKKELNIEMCVSGRRQFQYLAIINIRGAWEGAPMDTVFIGPPYLSGVFLWSAYLRNRQELVTRFKIAHYFSVSQDNLCSGSIFWKKIVLKGPD